jgi:hypothetical protein
MRDSTGKMAASVFPPAVGASTTALQPSRIASIVSSWTGPKRAPSQVVNDRVLQVRMKALESSHRYPSSRFRFGPCGLRGVVRVALLRCFLFGGLLDGPPVLGRQLLGRELAVVELELVVLARVVRLVDVDAVEHVDQLAQEQARREGDLAPESPP